MMLQAALGIVAALAFVLALGAFCVWALKKWGAGTLLPRSRVPVEIVQRIALGPKVGLAVVRVGEKVMAVSIGDGGVRTLFELDEADRLHILATSSVPTPLNSSATASADFARFLPSRLSRVFGRLREPELIADALLAPHASMALAAPASGMTFFAPPAPITAAFSTPTFSASGMSPAMSPPAATGVPTMSAGQAVTYSRIAAQANNSDRDFRAMLGLSLSGATRLMMLIGALAIASAVASPLRAQVAPPVPQARQQPVQQPVPTPVSQPTASPTDAKAIGSPAASQTAAPIIEKAPPTNPSLQDAAKSRVTPARPAQVAAQVASKGNGASTTAGGTRATRPTSQMVVDSTKGDGKPVQRANAAGVAPVAAEDAVMRLMPQMDMKIGDAKDGGLRLNGTVGIVVMMGLLTLLPTLLLMMTGFTRILVVLHFLKQAMGTQGAPPAQLLAGLALLLTGFVMAPTFTEVNRTAITPWMDGQISQVEMMKTGVKPMREFMLRQTRKEDLKTFVELSRMQRPNTVDDVPLHVLMSAFVASELRTSFQIGFMIYLPFIIIDAVVASVLMSMGMMMLPPAMISLPFKLLLFVLVDGWALTIQSLVQSFK